MTVIGGPLEPQHRNALHGRWIDDSHIEQAFLRSVGSDDGAEILGRKDSGDYAGIAIPYIDPGSDFVREYRIRRDHPEMENGKPKGKYIAPPGRGNMLYFVPGTQAEWLDYSDLPAWIVEGEFKAISLYRAAHHNLSDATLRPRALVIALPGVWNWRGTIGKTVDQSGARVDEKGVIPDLDKVAWSGRDVTIIFDSNVVANESVRVARKELTKELQTRGAKVRWFEWE